MKSTTSRASRGLHPAAKKALPRQPYAFTEHGVAMLASVLRSEQAAEVTIAIVRTFIRLRRMLATNEELARKVAQAPNCKAFVADTERSTGRRLRPKPLGPEPGHNQRVFAAG